MASQNPPLQTDPTPTDRLRKYFFGSLPGYYKENDTYKNEEGKGLLERFLGIFQTQAEQYLTEVDVMKTFVNAREAPYKFLPYIGSLYGKPPIPTEDDTIFSNILESIQFLNTYKGTLSSLESYFGVLGVGATINLVPRPIYNHDESREHDDYVVIHDSNTILCVKYTVNVEDPSESLVDIFKEPFTDNNKLAIQSIFRYFLPINMVMTDFQYNGVTQDIRLGEDIILIDWDPSTGDQGFIIGTDEGGDIGTDTTVIGV
jgi:hypothetical protein